MLSCSVITDSLWLHAVSLPGFSLYGSLQARILEWVVMPSPRGSSQPRDPTQVSRIAGRFFTDWATGKPKNSGVDTLPLFQAQELNYGLLHCLRIIYQLSYQWSPENIQLMIRKIWFLSQVFVKPQSSTGFSSTKYFICIYLMLVFWETAWNSGSREIYSDHLGRCWL